MESSRAIHPSILLLTIASFFACSLLAGCYPMLLTSPSIVMDDEDDDEETEKEHGDSEEQEGKHLDENDLLKEWEQPVFTLLVTGRQYGYIEPCGCTGLFNQKGGLMRRHQVQQLLKKRGWEAVSYTHLTLPTKA